jgi:phosphocarrier protein HPr
MDDTPHTTSCSAKAVVRNSAGIHCRPTAVIVKEARSFDVDSIVVRAAHGGSANPASAIELLALGLDQDSEVEIEVTGAEAAVCCEKLVTLFETHFDFPPREETNPVA